MLMTISMRGFRDRLKDTEIKYHALKGEKKKKS